MWRGRSVLRKSLEIRTPVDGSQRLFVLRMKGHGGQAAYHVESKLNFTRCIRQGGVEALALWRRRDEEDQDLCEYRQARALFEPRVRKTNIILPDKVQVYKSKLDLSVSSVFTLAVEEQHCSELVTWYATHGVSHPLW